MALGNFQPMNGRTRDGIWFPTSAISSYFLVLAAENSVTSSALIMRFCPHFIAFIHLLCNFPQHCYVIVLSLLYQNYSSMKFYYNFIDKYKSFIDETFLRRTRHTKF